MVIRDGQTGSEVETTSPTKSEAARSPSALTNLLASGLLLACFFLPHSVDCDNRSHRPITVAKVIVQESSEPSDLLALATFWPFAFAGLTLLLTIILIVARPPWFAQALLALPIATGGALGVLCILFLFSGTGDSRFAMAFLATAIPAAACVAARMTWLYRSGEVLAAAAWGQGMICVLAAFSLRWFWLPPITRMRWGGILAIAATMLMMMASWYWTPRGRHDFHDRSSKPETVRISLLQLILGISMIAIAMAYWRVLESR